MSRKTSKIEIKKKKPQGIEETRTLFFKKKKHLPQNHLAFKKKKKKITITLRAFVEILYSNKLENPKKLFNILDGYHL